MNRQKWVETKVLPPLQATTQLPLDSVLLIANQCPLTGGRVVFAARNLYNSLTEQNFEFEEACDNVDGFSRKKPKAPVNTNDLPLTIDVYPNPTTGYVYITLPNTNNKKICWSISATDILGKKIVEKQINVKATKTFIELKGNKGVYFIKVLNCNTGNLTVQKVILQ